MNITSAVYTEDGAIQAVIDGVTMTVPDDLANRHRVAIAEWELEGSTIDPYVAPPPPTPLTPLEQLEQATGLTLAEIQLLVNV